jgi:uncharacterized protein
MNTPAPAPWYRQAWPWFLIALPAAAVCGSFYTLYLAVSEPEAVVRDEYDRNGLEVTRKLEEDARARALGLEASLDFDTSGSVEVTLPQGASTPANLRLQLIHPTDQSQDRTVELQRGADGRYSAPLHRPEGRRYLQLEADGDRGAWRLRGVIGGEDGARARLLPGNE